MSGVVTHLVQSVCAAPPKRHSTVSSCQAKGTAFGVVQDLEVCEGVSGELCPCFPSLTVEELDPDSAPERLRQGVAAITNRIFRPRETAR